MQSLNIDNLNKHIADKVVNIQKHPKLDFWIYNYGQKAQWDRIWDTESMACRGLILNIDTRVSKEITLENIVARPFPKFFNLSEHLGGGGQIPSEDFVVTEKMDGSLGIVYRDADGDYSLATRGSFVSDQARKGTAMLRTPWRNQFLETASEYVLKGKTVLVEIIYPENRIVVDYGKDEKLTLLTVIDNKTGEEFPYTDLWELSVGLELPIVQKYDGITDFEHIESRPNSEGYVIHYPSTGQRFKVKFDEYVRLHKLVTGVNKKTVWELLMNNHPVDELLDRVPDEFFKWVNDTVTELSTAYIEIDTIAQNDFGELLGSVPGNFDYPEEAKEYRKNFAILASKTKYPSIMFNLLDGKPYDQVIWRLIKPVAEKPFKDDIDA